MSISYSLRSRDGQWTLVAHLPSMEDAATALAQLGKTEATVVDVLTYDEAIRKFVSKGAINLGGQPQATTAPLVRPIAGLKGRPPRRKVHFILMLTLLAAGAWMGRGAIISSLFGHPLDGSEATPSTGATAHAQSASPATSETALEPNENPLIGTVWGSPSCDSGYQMQFGSDYVAATASGKQSAYTPITYSKRGRYIAFDQAGLNTVIEVQGARQRTIRLEVSGITIQRPGGSPWVERCAGGPIAIQPDRDPIEPAVQRGLALAVGAGDANAVKSLLAGGARVTDAKTLSGFASQLPSPDLYRSVMTALGLPIQPGPETLALPGQPWSDATEIPAWAVGNYSANCNIGHLSIGPHAMQRIFHDEADPAQNFTQVRASGRRVWMMQADGSSNVFEFYPGQGSTLIGTFLPSGVRVSGDDSGNGPLVPMCS